MTRVPLGGRKICPSVEEVREGAASWTMRLNPDSLAWPAWPSTAGRHIPQPVFRYPFLSAPLRLLGPRRAGQGPRPPSVGTRSRTAWAAGLQPGGRALTGPRQKPGIAPPALQPQAPGPWPIGNSGQAQCPLRGGGRLRPGARSARAQAGCPRSAPRALLARPGISLA